MINTTRKNWLYQRYCELLNGNVDPENFTETSVDPLEADEDIDGYTRKYIYIDSVIEEYIEAGLCAPGQFTHGEFAQKLFFF